MNPERARRKLITWRPPPTADPAPDPEFDAALEEAAHDPALGDWFAAHRTFQQGLRDRLRSLPVPDQLAEQLRRAKGSRPTKVLHPILRRPAWALAAAAAFVAVLIAVGLLSRPDPEAPGFAVFRDRMVRAAIREYRMDLETSDLAVIRGHLGSQSAPADFELTPALAAATPVGGGVLSWQGKPVAMVCLRTPETGMLYLFVSEATFADAPLQPQLGHLSRLATAAWAADRRVFVLAAATTEESLRRFLPKPSRPPSRGQIQVSPTPTLIPACRLNAGGHGGPAHQPVVIGALVICQLDR